MSDPNPDDPNPPPPEFLTVLGLRVPVTVEDVKQAYLDKAKTAHPDRGGNPQDFVRLQQAFEQATEYARFKAGRMQWLSGWVEQYAEQQQLVDRIKVLGGTVEIESVDWLARTVGSDFATVLDRILVIRLVGPRVGDATLAELAENRRALAGLHHLALVDTKVTSDGLAHLHGFASLRELNLSGTQVEGGAVEALLDRLPQLEKLVLRGSGLNWPGRLKLRFSHRDLDIVF